MDINLRMTPALGTVNYKWNIFVSYASQGKHFDHSDTNISPNLGGWVGGWVSLCLMYEGNGEVEAMGTPTFF